MLSVKEIKELIKAVNESGLEEFNYEEEGTKLHLKKPSNGQVAQVTSFVPAVSHEVKETVEAEVAETVEASEQVKSAVSKEENLHTITSPMVGTFYTAPSPDSPVYVEAGDQVTEDTVVCIVEAMKLMNEIEAEIKGKIVEVLAENGELVEFGQPLFVVAPR
ncbi:acetyl-CoA carboxylase [Alkalihalobacillus alcalophilus ATCC 27647 = CGMCC 1.3604]|uniref:Biotin carboxyl carrier protein of acetyl-CoA carboxylase n=1 Tax=Alkalihalobacillus alcalophilus ATCC 27647 = CGMCC 1.3604 TaxID=1218173 RepID=A0A094WPG8_ALKAL|nr:acetyl-CoA carboxylase biotin carboxyl carrier protein [Alkalihalobacillus alcalophilus]KGA97903.1 acetyl-CoA carboxylase [Alkalihalobacillus alcalophilus ATCC 27647 = CGMCC 1.3604]MED1561479.1 acetyl-CoA carboxylase biotin carboxyl carrier protein [Alkalihalobacillus alcalophilus]THG88417.1 acetyl-CoA carboxylase [Alkalihalobacillus alcalophilus ATCC 27647 = CGMCC 1.3604]